MVSTPRKPSDTARRQRRALSLVGAVALLAFIAGVTVGAGGGGTQESSPSVAPKPPPELPRGGRTIFPDYRVVALYGAPQDEELGELGIGSPDQAGAKLLEQAKPYATKRRPVLPAMELIATIAAAEAGVRGDHTIRQPKRVIDRYLKTARKVDALLLLDIQPGYADFMGEVRRLEEYWRKPDVGLALDPEWHVQPPQLPGQVIGSVEAQAVNEVSAYLDEIVADEDLPQKLLVVHQFTDDMIANRPRLQDRQGLAIVLNSDGFSDPANKEVKYRELRPRGPTKEFHPGFKLFYREDAPLMTPKQVLNLKPKPEFIVYE